MLVMKDVTYFNIFWCATFVFSSIGGQSRHARSAHFPGRLTVFTSLPIDPAEEHFYPFRDFVGHSLYFYQ